MLGAANAQLKYLCQGVDRSLFLSNQTTQSCVYLPSNVTYASVAAVVGYNVPGIIIRFQVIFLWVSLPMVG